LSIACFANWSPRSRAVSSLGGLVDVIGEIGALDIEEAIKFVSSSTIILFLCKSNGPRFGFHPSVVYKLEIDVWIAAVLPRQGPDCLRRTVVGREMMVPTDTVRPSVRARSSTP
jgi:hypothetical protein